MRKLFKGGNYSRAETIWGNTVCPSDGKKGQKKMQMFFSVWYLLVLTLLCEGFDLFSCVLGWLETKSVYKSRMVRCLLYRTRHNWIWNSSLKGWPKKICHLIRNSKTNLTPFTRLSHPPSLFSSVRNPPVHTSAVVKLSHSHSWMGHYFFSYLLTWEVNLIEILEIMPQMLQYVIFLSLKPTKVTSDFTF